MRKLFALIAVLGMLTIGASKLMAQEDEAAPAAQTEQTTVSIDDEEIESTSMHAAIKQKFIEGGAGFMACVALCLIFGLAVAIERVIYLNLSDTNTKKFIVGFEDALNNGGIEAAKDYCRNTADLLQVFSIRDFPVTIRASTWLRNQLFLTDRYRWD